jgi:hypothetical protein
MNLIAVPCNICGASIEVAETTRFVTCDKCQCQLAVIRAHASVFTEFKSDQNASEPRAYHEAVAAYQDEIDRIDSDWQAERDEFSMLWSQDALSEDDRSATKLYCVLTALIFLPVAAVLFFVDWSFALLSALIGTGGILYYLRIGTIERDFQRAEIRYRQRRAAVRLEDFLRAHQSAPEYSHSL